MDKQKVLSKLLLDLQDFLSVLDSENLSYIAQAQRKSISALLNTLTQDNYRQHPAVEDAEYMIMSCSPPSPSNELTDTPESVLVSLWPRRESQCLTVPPHPPGGLGEEEDDDDDDDDDEEDDDDRDEDTYEEAQPYTSDVPVTEHADSDSSLYESYGDEDETKDDGQEEEESGADPDDHEAKDSARYIVQWGGSQPCVRPAHSSGDLVQWDGSQPCVRPAPSGGESRLCGYLWRKKWLGTWTKQLCVIRKQTLLCYKCAADLHPQVELDLRGGRVLVVRPGGRGRGKGREVEAELKVVVGSDSLTLGFSDQSHALEWRQVIEEVSVSTSYDLTQRVSSMFFSELPLACRSSAVLLCEESSPPNCHNSNNNNNNKGFLNVLMNCQWQSLLCQVEAGLLKMFGEEEECDPERTTPHAEERTPQYTLRLGGCEVNAAADSETSNRIALLQHGDTVAVLEAGCQEDKDRWLQLLQDGAVNHHRHDDDNNTPEKTGALTGLTTRRFPTSNNYMDDPFHQSGGAVHQSGTAQNRPPLHQSGTVQPQPIYSNASILEHMFQTNQDEFQGDSVTYSNTIFTNHNIKVQRGVQKLELAGGRSGGGAVQLRAAGSEVNLTAAVSSAAKQNKRSSFRQSLAFYSEKAGFLNPLLRRTASAKTSLKRAPSSLFTDHGKVSNRKKEWEAKAAA